MEEQDTKNSGIYGYYVVLDPKSREDFEFTMAIVSNMLRGLREHKGELKIEMKVDTNVK